LNLHWHPSLNLYNPHGEVWSVRVTDNYRASGVEDDPGIITWFWIGDHDDYERILGNR
jgi:hypothetical protein